jgi:hypothetical protein
MIGPGVAFSAETINSRCRFSSCRTEGSVGVSACARSWRGQLAADVWLTAIGTGACLRANSVIATRSVKRTAALDIFTELNLPRERARRSIWMTGHHVAGGDVPEKLQQLAPVGLRSAGFLAVDVHAALGAKSSFETGRGPSEVPPAHSPPVPGSKSTLSSRKSSATSCRRQRSLRGSKLGDVARSVSESVPARDNSL